MPRVRSPAVSLSGSNLGQVVHTHVPLFTKEHKLVPTLCSHVIITFFCKKNNNNEWGKIDQQLSDSAIKQWRKRLAACVSARGGHMEHML